MGIDAFASCSVLAVLTTSYSVAISTVKVDGKLPFHIPSSVLYTELFKFALMAMLGIFQGCDFRIQSRRDAIVLIVPSAFFTIQNNLNYITLQYIDPVTFQIVNATKIVATAVLSRYILNRRIDHGQWLAIGFVCVGVVATQSCGTFTTTDWTYTLGVLLGLFNQTIGAVGLVCNEYALKNVPEMSFSTKNAIIYFFGVLCSLPFWHPSTIYTFDATAWGTSLFLGVVGICVAVVIAVTSSNAKTFVSAGALCLTGITMSFVDHRPPTLSLMQGTATIALASYLYKLHAPVSVQNYGNVPVEIISRS